MLPLSRTGALVLADPSGLEAPRAAGARRPRSLLAGCARRLSCRALAADATDWPRIAALTPSRRGGAVAGGRAEPRHAVGMATGRGRPRHRRCAERPPCPLSPVATVRGDLLVCLGCADEARGELSAPRDRCTRRSDASARARRRDRLRWLPREERSRPWPCSAARRRSPGPPPTTCRRCWRRRWRATLASPRRPCSPRSRWPCWCRRRSARSPAGRSIAGAAGRCWSRATGVRPRPRRPRRPRTDGMFAAWCCWRRHGLGSQGVRGAGAPRGHGSRNLITSITLIAGFASTVGWRSRPCSRRRSVGAAPASPGPRCCARLPLNLRCRSGPPPPAAVASKERTDAQAARPDPRLVFAVTWFEHRDGGASAASASGGGATSPRRWRSALVEPAGRRPAARVRLLRHVHPLLRPARWRDASGRAPCCCSRPGGAVRSCTAPAMAS